MGHDSKIYFSRDHIKILPSSQRHRYLRVKAVRVSPVRPDSTKATRRKKLFIEYTMSKSYRSLFDVLTPDFSTCPQAYFCSRTPPEASSSFLGGSMGRYTIGTHFVYHRTPVPHLCVHKLCTQLCRLCKSQGPNPYP